MARPDPEQFLDSFGALSRSVRTVAARAYADFEVGGTQARFLRHIGENRAVSQADLARATATDPALTGRALQPLISRGWVRRKRSEEDRRQYLLELAPAGQRMRKRVEEARKRVAERVVAALDERDIQDFHRVAHKIVAALDGPT